MGDQKMPWRLPDGEITTSSASPSLPSKGKKGPYELLTKERLMGIYIAVYVHRDAKPHVQGVYPFILKNTGELLMFSFLGLSQSSVTAGLIGGRLGNKGGIGVSLNIAGTSLLFINAHLAGMWKPTFFLTNQYSSLSDSS